MSAGDRQPRAAPVSTEPGWSMLFLTINDRCPLRCRHCSLGFDGDYSGTRRELSARDITGLIEGLDTDVYDSVCFAGGEPSLSPRLLEVGIDACHAHGFRPGMVTAPVWAKSREAAGSYLDKLPQFDFIILSLDNYHLEFLPIAHYENVVSAASARGVRTVILSCVSSSKEQAELSAMTRHLRTRVFHTFQAVVPVGNARTQVETHSTVLTDRVSLLSISRSCSIPTTTVVAIDKDVRACCWATCEDESPLRFSADLGRGIAGAVRAVADDPTVRRLGEVGLIGSLSEEGQQAVVDELRGRSFVNECHLCIELMSRASLWERYVAPQPSTLRTSSRVPP